MKTRLLLLTFFILSSLFLILPSSAHAQFQNPNFYNTTPDVPSNNNTHIQSSLINIAATISCFMTGYDPTNPDGKCLGIDPQSKKLTYVKDSGGLIGITGNLISATFYIPVSTHDYGSYVASKFGITKQTYAQNPGSGSPDTGIGFSALSPTLKLWTAFRNLTYLLFVILFVIVGLGIMFRIKIDPRTVMTLQNQIPKIIIALVLVTFSYAIAGFLVDMMYVSLYLIISIFAQQGYDTVNIFSSNPFGAIGGIGGMSGIANNVAGSISGVLTSIFDGTLGNTLQAVIGGIIGSFVGGQFDDFSILGTSIPLAGIGMLVGGGLGFFGGNLGGDQIAGFVTGLIAYIIVIIALFSALLRLWFILIKAYIYLMISVVFAPFSIALGLIPGRSGFGAWVRGLLSNLVVFPTTIVILLLGKAFMDGFTKGEIGNAPIAPPMVGDFANPQMFASIIGLAIILMLPEVAKMAQETLKTSEFKYGSGLGKFTAVGVGMTTAIPKKVGGEFFGTDRMGNPKEGTEFMTRRFGRLVGGLFGGHGAAVRRGPDGRTIHENPLIRLPFGRRNNRPQGNGGNQGPQNPPAGGGGGGGGGPQNPPAGGGGNAQGQRTPLVQFGGIKRDSALGRFMPRRQNRTQEGNRQTTQQANGAATPTTTDTEPNTTPNPEEEIENYRRALLGRGQNTGMVNQRVAERFGEEANTENPDELRQILEQQNDLLDREQNEERREAIQRRIERLEAKIRRIEGNQNTA